MQAINIVKLVDGNFSPDCPFLPQSFGHSSFSHDYYSQLPWEYYSFLPITIQTPKRIYIFFSNHYSNSKENIIFSFRSLVKLHENISFPSDYSNSKRILYFPSDHSSNIQENILSLTLFFLIYFSLCRCYDKLNSDVCFLKPWTKPERETAMVSWGHCDALRTLWWSEDIMVSWGHYDDLRTLWWSEDRHCGELRTLCYAEDIMLRWAYDGWSWAHHQNCAPCIFRH